MGYENALISQWLEEESVATMLGWDFSHIQERYSGEPELPWDYGQLVKQYLTPDTKLLDMDTGGGEFLLSLNHPPQLTSATEGWPPNVELCQKTLLPLGIDFRPADTEVSLPFDDNTFDLVINRHGSYHPREIHRVLKPGGIFLTQQMGAENDREFVNLLFSRELPLPFPEQYLSVAENKFQCVGFEILDGQECFRPMRFYDVGALVWFARIIQWEFPGFSVETCLDGLNKARRIMEQQGYVEGNIHRFLLIARK